MSAETLHEANVLMQPESVATQPFDRDLALHYYTSGADKAEIAQAGIDTSQILQLIRQMPDDEREYFKGLRREGMFRRQAKDKLSLSNPELFEGRVPAELETRIAEAGYQQYAVGFNQSEGVTSLPEALDLLRTHEGVELGMYNSDQRFLLHDATAYSEEYPMGYFGPKMGRFVYAIPVASEAQLKPKDEANDTFSEYIPSDVYVENAQGELVANVKYCAGFIDNEQVFHTNPHFMKGAQDSSQQRERVPVIEAPTQTPTSERTY